VLHSRLRRLDLETLHNTKWSSEAVGCSFVGLCTTYVLRVVSIQLIIIENILLEKSRPYVFVSTGFLLSEAEVRYFVVVIYFVLTVNKLAFETFTWFL